MSESESESENEYLFLFYTKCSRELFVFDIVGGWDIIPGHEGTISVIRPYYEDEEIITSDDGKLPFRYSEVICFTGPSTTREEMKLCLEKKFFELQHEGYISVFEVSEEWKSY